MYDLIFNIKELIIFIFFQKKVFQLYLIKQNLEELLINLDQIPFAFLYLIKHINFHSTLFLKHRYLHPILTYFQLFVQHLHYHPKLIQILH